MLSHFSRRARKKTQVITDLSVSFLEPGKIMEGILGVTEKHPKDSTAIGHNQHRFTRRKFCLTNLMSFYGKVSHHVDQGNPANVIFWDFSRAFSAVSPSILYSVFCNLPVFSVYSVPEGPTIAWNHGTGCSGQWAQLWAAGAHSGLDFGWSCVNPGTGLQNPCGVPAN